MSKRLQIRQALYGIEQGEFQDVCNYYLGKIYGGELFSPGSVEAKNKTRPGKPDTYIVLDDGKYILVEITTHDNLDKKKFEKKLKDDLKGCLNFKSLGITARQIHSIVLCCNSTIDIELRCALNQMVESDQIKLRFVPILTLVDYFYNVGKVFARDVLRIPFETGQVLSKEEFLQQYSKRQIATPLDNELVGREKELNYIKDAIEFNHVTLIYGPAGVGKSRLAIQAVDNFVVQHSEYKPYYIVSRPESITEDLLSFILPGYFYILFIDDANRQLENVLSVLSRAIDKDIKLKIVMTVRDYARPDIEKHMRDVNFVGAYVGQLSDEIIDDILFANPFDIKNPRLRERIVNISNGNARLAIMSANVVKENNDINLLKDVTTIYDHYFQSIADDASVLSEPLTAKVLGLLSFFQTIDTDEPDEVNILDHFGIAIDEFQEKVQLLESLEVVEVNYGSIVKIGDQVLGTYFFYQAFFRKKHLDAERLIFNYFQRYVWRVRDTFIPAINTFGLKNLLGDPEFLLNYLSHIQNNAEETISFLQVFGIYLPQKLFAFVSRFTHSLPESNDHFEFQNLYRQRQPSDHDHVLNLLKQFYQGNTKDCITAIGLAVSYIQKRKPLLEILVNDVRGSMYAGIDDVRESFERQKAIYTFLLARYEENGAYRILFYYAMKNSLLNDSFDNAVFTTINNKTAFKPIFGDLRVSFLKAIDQNYKNDQLICFDLLMSYLDVRGRGTFVYLHTDQSLIVNIIKNHFDKHSFGDCYWVQSYIDLLIDRNIAIIAELKRIQGKFQNREFEIFKILEADRNSKRQKFRDIDDFNKSLDAQLNFVKKSLPVTVLADFITIHNAVTVYRNFTYWHRSSIQFGLTLVLESVFEKDAELGCNVLEYYLQKGNLAELIPRRLFNVFFQTQPSKVDAFYSLLRTETYRFKQEWLETFFECLPEQLITPFFIKQLLITFEKVSKRFKLHLPSYQQYERVKPGTIKDICEVLMDWDEENVKRGFGFELPYRFFQDYPLMRDRYFDTAKRLYIQQDKSNHNHDPDGSGLFFLMETDVAFFNVFIEHRLEIFREHYVEPRQDLTQIWEFKESCNYVFNVLVSIANIQGFSISVERFCANLFSRLKPEMELPAIDTLKKLIKIYSDDANMLSIIWNIARNYLERHYKGLIIFWLKFEPTLDVFRKCDWTNGSFSSVGSRQIWSDFRITEFRQVAEAIEEMDDRFKFVEHEDWLVDRINRERKAGEWDRKRIYRGFD